MKKYIVTDGRVEKNAAASGIDINAFKESDDGPEPTDASRVANEPIKFNPSTTSWNVPSGEGFLCYFYHADTHPETALPLTAESLDEFANE